MKSLCLLFLLLLPVSAYSQQLELVKSINPDQVHKYTGFTLEYDESTEQAFWVAYELTRSEVARTVRRTDDFRPDPNISTGSAILSDYKGSGYDRGHLAPAGDMKFSRQTMIESFYMSNMSPQLPAFNRGICVQPGHR